MSKINNISVLGSTGSIGQNTLKIVEMFPGRFAIKALAAKSNIKLLASQIERFSPEIVAVYDDTTAHDLKSAIRFASGVEIMHGEEGYKAVAACGSADMVVSAMVGAAGLTPTLAAIDAGKTVALANKETLVMAGEIVISKAAKKKVKILPVDSEHSAIFQCLAGNRLEDLDKILLTGSGGPFLQKTKSEFHSINPEDALNHPTWQMGNKISIDSATLMNKGLEVIEARHLFGIALDKIEVLIHPQSIVHSMVSFIDGTVIAQLGIPDMKGAIAYAMSYPARLNLKQPLPDFVGLQDLTFEDPDLEKFPCLGLAYQACQTGATLPTALNAANEIAVAAFLNKRISFEDIPDIISEAMDKHHLIQNPGINDILEADRQVRVQSKKIIKRLANKQA